MRHVYTRVRHDLTRRREKVKPPAAKYCFDISWKLGKESQNKNMDVFYFFHSQLHVYSRYIRAGYSETAFFDTIAHEKGFEFHSQPQTGAYSYLVDSDTMNKKVGGGAL